MNWGQSTGDWHQLSHKLKQKWKLLTDADLTAIAGRRDLPEDILRDRYGYERTRATMEIDRFTEMITS